MITDAQDVLVKNAEPSLSSMENVVMPDKNPLLSGLENQDVTMQDPDIFHSELHYMPGPSSDINMQQFVFPG
jgi:hypothetical protein